MSNSLKKNFAYKGLLTFANYIIGFVTFPYITRVLGPSNFGLVNFAQNTIDYFLLFATMGINTIGTREIAAAMGNKSDLNKTYSSLFGLNATFTTITLAIYLLCIWLVPRFNENQELFYIGAAKIIFTLFTVEWLFTGLEDFKFITIRSLLIRLASVICVFIFVREQTDYILYFAIIIGGVVLNAIVNFIYSRRFVTIIWRNFISSKFLKSNLRLGLYTIMTSMYITFNVMYLGLVSDDVQVGYYSTAVKLYFIAVSLFGAFTAVMVPRMSALNAAHNQKSIQNYFSKSFYLAILSALPIIILSEFFAPEIIEILSGPDYECSITPMRILMPALLLVWISQVIAFQTFIPLRKDNVILTASLIGGILAIILNLCITPTFKSIGSAIILLCCEISVTAYYVLMAKKNRIVMFPKLKIILHYFVMALPYVVICLFSILLFNRLVAFILSFVLSTIYIVLIKPLQRVRQ